MRLGKLTVNVGSMFSGKSTELLRQGKRYELAGKRVLYVKPITDSRYSDNAVVTHDRKQAEALLVAPDDAHGIIRHMRYVMHENYPDAVLIDEGQFFSRNLLYYSNKLLRIGIDVFVSGLDMDRHGQPFGIMPDLMAVADHVQKFHAVCKGCGADAYVSFNHVEGYVYPPTALEEDTILVGGTDTYEPLCRTCWESKKKAV